MITALNLGFAAVAHSGKNHDLGADIATVAAAIAAVAGLIAVVLAGVTVGQGRQAHREQEEDRTRAREDREQDRQERNADRREVESERQRRRLEEAEDRREADRRRWRGELMEIGRLVEDVVEASSGPTLPQTRDFETIVGPHLNQLRRALIGHKEQLPRCVALIEDVKNGMYDVAAIAARAEIEEKLRELGTFG